MIQRAIYLFALVAILVSCRTDPETKETLSWAERAMNQRPDSVARVLSQLDRKKLHSKQDRAHYALLYSQALDKSDVNIASDTLIRQAVNYYSEQGPSKEQALAYYYLGVVYDCALELDQAVEAFTYAQIYASECQDSHLLALIHSRFGNLYLRQHRFEQAIDMYRLAIEGFSQEGERGNKLRMLHAMGLALLKLERKQEAIPVLKEAEKLAMELNQADDVIEIFSALGLAQIGTTYLSLDEYYRDAEIRLNAYYTHYTKGEIPLYHYPYIGQIMRHRGDLDSAYTCYTTYLADPRSCNDDDIIYYRHLSSLEWDRGNYQQALLYEQTYSNLADSLHNANQEELVSGLKQKYLAQYAQDSYQLLQEKHRYMIICTLLLIAILCYLLVNIIFRYRREKSTRQQELEQYRAFAEQTQQHYGELQERYTSLAHELNLKDENLKGIYTVLGNRIEELRKIVELAHTHGHNTEQFYKRFKETIKLSSSKSQTLAKDMITFANMTCNGAINYLQKHYPNLTQHELCYCAFVMLDFTKESIRILYNHTNQYSIYNIQNSIRNKIGLVNQNSGTLESYLTDLKCRIVNQSEQQTTDNS